jgi:hypothetical protein
MPAARRHALTAGAPPGYAADRITVISSNDGTAADDGGAKQTAKRGHPAPGTPPQVPT